MHGWQAYHPAVFMSISKINKWVQSSRSSNRGHITLGTHATALYHYCSLCAGWPSVWCVGVVFNNIILIWMFRFIQQRCRRPIGKGWSSIRRVSIRYYRSMETTSSRSLFPEYTSVDWLPRTIYRERRNLIFILCLFIFIFFFHIFSFTPSSGFPHHSTSLFRNRQVDHIGMAVLWLSFIVVCHTPSLVLAPPYPLVIFIHTFSFAQLIIQRLFIKIFLYFVADLSSFSFAFSLIYSWFSLFSLSFLFGFYLFRSLSKIDTQLHV